VSRRGNDLNAGSLGRAGSTLISVFEPRKRRGIKIIHYDARPGVREFERVGRAVEQAKLKVPIAASFALSGAARAYERLAAGHVLGKIVLRIR
jgi:NADPH:quinone reductase